MSQRRLLDRIADFLASWSGDQTRASEVRGHLADAEEAGHSVDLRMVGSLGTLVLRRALRDIPWWVAGSPVALIFLAFVADNFGRHFAAWGLASQDEFPRTAATNIWILVVNGLAATMVVAGLGAGRAAIHHLRSGRIGGPLVLLTAILIAISQGNIFIERTPWWRDGSLTPKPEQINEVPFYSVFLFALVAMIPVMYLAVSALVWRRANGPRRAISRRTHTGESETVEEIDPVAITAAGLPLLVTVGGFPLLFLALIFTWAARSFSRRLKILATSALLLPLVGALLWTTFVSDIDDAHPAIFIGPMAISAAVWLRMAFLALRPLRTVRVRLQIEKA